MNEHNRNRGNTLLKIKEAQDAARLQETVQVLSQPHRRGDSSELRESALGAFIIDSGAGIECFHAADEYRCLVYKWQLATGIHVPAWVREEFGGSGEEMDGDRLKAWAETIDDWNKKRKDCEKALKAAGITAFEAAQRMIFEDFKPDNSIVLPVKRALLSLAIELGKFPY